MAFVLMSLEPTCLPCTVTLKRLGKRKLDTDNLAGSFKHVRDSIAKWLGVDDGDDQVAWLYVQEQSKDYWIEVSIADHPG